MNIEVKLAKLRAKVNYPADHFHILFGNAWEVQFFCHGVHVATGIDYNDLGVAIDKCLLELDNPKPQKKREATIQ